MFWPLPFVVFIVVTVILLVLVVVVATTPLLWLVATNGNSISSLLLGVLEEEVGVGRHGTTTRGDEPEEASFSFSCGFSLRTTTHRLPPTDPGAADRLLGVGDALVLPSNYRRRPPFIQV